MQERGTFYGLHLTFTQQFSLDMLELGYNRL